MASINLVILLNNSVTGLVILMLQRKMRLKYQNSFQVMTLKNGQDLISV